MLRSLSLLSLLLATTPLFAQWETRIGARAGIAQYEAEGFRYQVHSNAPAAGADFWARKGHFALDLGVDAYSIKGPGIFWLGSADALLLLGPVAIGGGPLLVTTEGEVDTLFAPVLQVNIPLLKQRQMYAVLRRHTSSPGLDRAETTILMFGMRSGPRGR